MCFLNDTLPSFYISSIIYFEKQKYNTPIFKQETPNPKTIKHYEAPLIAIIYVQRIFRTLNPIRIGSMSCREVSRTGTNLRESFTVPGRDRCTQTPFVVGK